MMVHVGIRMVPQDMRMDPLGMDMGMDMDMGTDIHYDCNMTSVNLIKYG